MALTQVSQRLVISAAILMLMISRLPAQHPTASRYGAGSANVNTRATTAARWSGSNSSFYRSANPTFYQGHFPGRFQGPFPGDAYRYGYGYGSGFLYDPYERGHFRPFDPLDDPVIRMRQQPAFPNGFPGFRPRSRR